MTAATQTEAPPVAAADIPIADDAALVPTEGAALAIRHTTGNDIFWNPETFEHLKRLAKVFNASSLVPAHYRGPENIANCMIAIQAAHRMGLDYMAYMQNTYVTSGKPAIEGKLAIALVNERGPFRGPVQFDWSGEGDDYGCTATGIRKDGNKSCSIRVDIKTAKAEGWYARNPKWKTIPQMMTAYRAGAWLGRLFCPEVLLGMLTSEEAEDIGAVPVGAIVNGQPVRASISMNDLAPRAETAPPIDPPALPDDGGEAPADEPTPPEPEDKPEPEHKAEVKPIVAPEFSYSAAAIRALTAEGNGPKPGATRGEAKKMATAELDRLTQALSDGNIDTYAEAVNAKELDLLAEIRADLEARAAAGEVE